MAKVINTSKFVKFLEESIKDTYKMEGRANNKTHMTVYDYATAMEEVASRNNYEYILRKIVSEDVTEIGDFMEEEKEEEMLCDENADTYRIFKEKFPDRLKQCLENAGMTQRELADAIHVAETTVSKYINGTRVPKAPMITAMARALKVSEHSLLHFYTKDESSNTYVMMR